MQVRREIVGDKNCRRKSRKLTRANMYFQGERRRETNHRSIPGLMSSNGTCDSWRKPKALEQWVT